MAQQTETARPRFFSIRGAADYLRLTTERTRQLFRNGTIPTTAQLNDDRALVDLATLRRIAEQRAARRAQGRRPVS